MSDDKRGEMRVVVVAGRGKGRGFSLTNPYGTPETTTDEQQATG